MKRAFIVVVVVAGGLAMAWWLGAFSSPPSAPETPSPSAKSERPSSPKSTKTEPSLPLDDSSHLADTLNSPATDIRSDLRVVSEVVDAFRTNFPRDGNPVGDNSEI